MSETLAPEWGERCCCGDCRACLLRMLRERGGRIAELEKALEVARSALGVGIGEVAIPKCYGGSASGYCGQDPCPHGDVTERLCVCGGNAPCDDLKCPIGAALAKLLEVERG